MGGPGCRECHELRPGREPLDGASLPSLRASGTALLPCLNLKRASSFSHRLPSLTIRSRGQYLFFVDKPWELDRTAIPSLSLSSTCPSFLGGTRSSSIQSILSTRCRGASSSPHAGRVDANGLGLACDTHVRADVGRDDFAERFHELSVGHAQLGQLMGLLIKIAGHPRPRVSRDQHLPSRKVESRDQRRDDRDVCASLTGRMGSKQPPFGSLPPFESTFGRRMHGGREVRARLY